jgi:hypothetical protein
MHRAATVHWYSRRGGGADAPHMGVRYLLSVLIVAAYAVYMVHKYGARDGLVATYLTWSFFVLGTPVADAGGILDVPLRLLTGVPMVVIEACVTSFTIASMFVLVHYKREEFDRTGLLRAFRVMLTTPYPYWGLIALCVVGTILSVWLGDMLIDAVSGRALPPAFWVGALAYAALLSVYVVGMMPLLRPMLQGRNAYSALF